MGRWILFLLMIALGAAAGLFYGWVLQPVQQPEAVPQNLRVDYRTDYVLMVAEAYQAEGDLAAARQRLSLLGPEADEAKVAQAIEFAQRPGYAQQDRSLLQDLQVALLADASLNPSPQP